jgi:excisionase family DNA binding protein
VAAQRRVSEKSPGGPRFSARLDCCRPGASRLVHLVCMETTSRPTTELGPVLTLSQLVTQLGVSTQTLYDLRSQGRGRRGFRVGRELRFRVSEVDDWLAQKEADDARRHPLRAG